MNILVVSQYYYPEPFRVNEICEEEITKLLFLQQILIILMAKYMMDMKIRNQ